MKANRILVLIAGILLITSGNFLYAQSDYKIAEQDSLALVAFYTATDGPNWISNQDGFGVGDLTSEWQGIYDGGFNKWLEGPVKDWFGVTVKKLPIANSNDSIYRVVKLWPVIGRRTDGQNQLNGYIPREVGLLTALEDFMVNGNNGLADTEIPDEVYHETLKVIDLEAVNLGGDVSDAFRNCTDIRKPNFRYNSFDYFPNVDFLDKTALDKLESSFFLYSTEIPLSNFEKIIDYFYSISPTPKEYGIQMRDVNNVGDELEVVAPLGSSVDMECIFAGEKEDFITYQWLKDGSSKFGKTNRTYSITAVSESDYGAYTTKITNDYVKAYDGNSNWGEINTKAIHLVPAPVAPIVEWATTSYNGKELHLRFSKPMDETISGFADFSVLSDGNTLQVTGSRTEGRLLRDVYLELDGDIALGEVVLLNYAGSSVSDKNGGILETISDYSVENLVRVAPAFVDARTTKDGKGVEIEFDSYIDLNSINIADFSLTGDITYSFSLGTLKNGEIDNTISKTILLYLSQSITDSLEVLSISYAKGELSGLYGGVVQSFTDVSVSNEVSLTLTEVTLYFEDGSKNIENVLAEGSWGIIPIQMYDDGTNGDEIAGDHIWTAQQGFVENDYTWDVVSRIEVQSYDTTTTTDPVTGVITQIITPVTENQDSILSGNIILEFNVADNTVSGNTSFGIQNVDVVFNVSVKASEQIYLMGIDEDWLTGLPLDRVGNSDTYTITLSGNTIGDMISYNYRDGAHWENQTVEPRSYTVVAGDNIINDSFFTYTSSKKLDENKVKIYPNPVQNQLTISGVDDLKLMQIYDSSGQLVYKQYNFEGTISLDMSDYKSGIYYLRMVDTSNNSISKKIIKSN